MADNLTPDQRRKTMQSIRSKGTIPEIIVARELKHRKIYFAQHVKSILGQPDFVFRRKKVAVFIDSDFWHGNPLKFIMPKSNINYWGPKIERNRKRDKEVTSGLEKEGWKVIRLWESDLKKDFKKSFDKILQALQDIKQK